MAVNFHGASIFNVFVFDDLNLSNTFSEGPAAVGGNVTTSNYSVSTALSPIPPFGVEDTFVIGGDVNISGGQNTAGNTAVSPTTTVIQYTMSNPNGEFRVGSSVDFAFYRTYLQCASTFWAGLAPNGIASVSFNQLFLTGINPSLNIFQIDAANVAGSGLSLSGLSGIDILAPVGATILINVTGTNIAFGSYQIFRNGVPEDVTGARKIVWNFPQAATWTNATTNIFGSVLAPLAAANTTFSQVYGNFIAKSLTGNLESRNQLFNGALPDPLPCLRNSSTSSTTSSTSTTSSSSTSTSSTSSSTSSTSSSTSTTSTTTADPFIPGIEQILVSIGAEELALAALINAEATKTLAAVNGFANHQITINDLIAVNSEVSNVLKRIIQKEITLEFKLDDLIRLVQIRQSR